MPLFDINGVQVNFPFQPYDCQLDYMQKVIECLKTNVNGVLESPTGTGKTLCLLCSSLAWQESRKAQTEFNRQVSVSSLLGKDAATLSEQGLQGLAKSLESSTGTAWGGTDFAVPKIIYASRTHSQLSQVIQELKRTAYNSVKVSVIGSRDQLCIHEQIKKELNNTNKVHMCRAKVNSRTCYYYNHLDDLKKNSEPRMMMGNVVDIEDLVGYGQKNRVCPYYMARELKGDADIIFMPYNYLLDPKTRKAHGVELQGNVIIFDEAHNLEKICEESASFDLKPGDLATAIEELTRVAEKMVELIKGESEAQEYADNTPEPEFNLDDILRLKSTLKDLEDQIDLIQVPNNGKGLTLPGMFMFEMLAKANIVYSNKTIIVDTLDKIIGFINGDATASGAGISKGAGLTKIADILKIIFSQEVTPGSSTLEHQEKMSRSYKVHVQKDEPIKKKKQMDLWTNSSAAEKSGKTVSYWCFSPGHSMSDLLAHGIKCIVLTSGTLSPLDSFTAEMQIPFPVRLENPHVIEKHQVWIGTLRKGPDGTVLNSNYETRYTVSYQASLGNCIVNFARVVPNGLLIFFPSYPVMEKCLELWKEKGIWTRIEQYKQIFVESKSKGVLNDLMNDFYSKINDPSLNGAIFIAVCRGKVSEGLDFSDINGRAVVITGLPYPPYLDPKVVLKMQYLDDMRGKQGFQSLSGKEWYKQQASRAVNQAIGRVIRHKQDFGAIMLCDTRFASSDCINQLPVWVRPHVKKYDTFGQAVKDAMLFFKTAEKVMPEAKPQKQRVCGSGGGAYFPLTVSRSGRGPDTIHPSSRVVQHVPSLKHKEEVVSNDRLKADYASSTGSTQASGTKTSLFSALAQSENNLDGSLSETQIPSYQGSPADCGQRKPFNKKKIIIKKRGSASMTDPTESSTEVSSQVTISHVNSAEQYIAEVKSSLDADSYKLFSRTLVEYKKTEQLEQMCAVLADLFIANQDNVHLFAKFYRFVRPKHKQKFHEMCLELTGLPTTYKPEDTVSRKRLQQQTSQETASKRLKTEGGSERDGTTNKDNTTRCPSAQTVSSGMENQPVSCTLGPCSKNSTQTQGNKQGLLPGSLSAGTEKSCTKMGTNYCTEVDKESQENAKPVSNRNCDVINNSGATNYCDRSEKQMVTSGDKKSSLTTSGYECCLCNHDAKTPFRSQCDHVCCMMCWRQVFEGDKLCPVCRARVRRRYLTQLFFPNVPDNTTDCASDDAVHS